MIYENTSNIFNKSLKLKYVFIYTNRFWVMYLVCRKSIFATLNFDALTRQIYDSWLDCVKYPKPHYKKSPILACTFALCSPNRPNHIRHRNPSEVWLHQNERATQIHRRRQSQWAKLMNLIHRLKSGENCRNTRFCAANTKRYELLCNGSRFVYRL